MTNELPFDEWAKLVNKIKQALEDIDLKNSIDINLQEFHFKNGEIITNGFELKVDYRQLAADIATYFEHQNLTIKENETI